MHDVDCIVIGAGVVGLAVARALARARREVFILERERHFGMHTSSRNSEVIHAGIHYEPHSLKATLCRQGRDLLYRYCSERGIAHRRCGKLTVATREAQVPTLEAIADNARARWVLNCAGLWADRVAASIEGFPQLCIPRTRFAKGSYFALSGASPFSRLVYPAPQAGGHLGIHMTVDLAGAARFGPDTEWVESIDYAVDPTRAGMFAAIVNLFGVDSPGLTASLAIGEHIAKIAD